MPDGWHECRERLEFWQGQLERLQQMPTSELDKYSGHAMGVIMAVRQLERQCGALSLKESARRMMERLREKYMEYNWTDLGTEEGPPVMPSRGWLKSGGEEVSKRTKSDRTKQGSSGGSGGTAVPRRTKPTKDKGKKSFLDMSR